MRSPLFFNNCLFWFCRVFPQVDRPDGNDGSGRGRFQSLQSLLQSGAKRWRQRLHCECWPRLSCRRCRRCDSAVHWTLLLIASRWTTPSSCTWWDLTENLWTIMDRTREMWKSATPSQLTWESTGHRIEAGVLSSSCCMHSCKKLQCSRDVRIHQESYAAGCSFRFGLQSKERGTVQR